MSANLLRVHDSLETARSTHVPRRLAPDWPGSWPLATTGGQHDDGVGGLVREAVEVSAEIRDGFGSVEQLTCASAPGMTAPTI